MLELAIKGGKKYYGWMTFLMVIVGVGFLFYLRQLDFGLGITGLSRDTSWGFYIANFTFLVGVAAGGVMVVLPYYLHDYKAFGRVTILGEFLAIASVIMCVTFILVDLGQPMRIFNVFIYPSLRSVLFWDTIVLNGYLFLNIIIGWNVLEAERNNIHYQAWLKPLIYLSIPWAVSIHTVTAYLYCGLPGRGFWMTAILAPRFLSSAFAAGPALLILCCLIIRRVSSFDPGREQIQALAKIVAYAICINVFFFLCEVFVVFYSNIPEHIHHFQFLFMGLPCGLLRRHPRNHRLISSRCQPIGQHGHAFDCKYQHNHETEYDAHTQQHQFQSHQHEIRERHNYFLLQTKRVSSSVLKR